MPFDRTEFDEFRKRAGLADAQLPHIRQEFHRAALDMTQITGIPQWDVFSTYVNGWIDRLSKQNDSLRRAMESPSLTDEAEIRALRQAIITNNIRMDTLREVIAFPRQVLEAEAAINAANKETVDG